MVGAAALRQAENDEGRLKLVGFKVEDCRAGTQGWVNHCRPAHSGVCLHRPTQLLNR